jgi:lysophospholipase L1-like esterase
MIMDDKLFPPLQGAASFVAMGDSFTEGLNDVAPGGGFRGWADRLAELLAAEYPGLRYANLAVRGKLLRQIVAEQVPVAAAMSPGLVSIAGGGNDILRPGADPDVLAELFDAGIARLRATGTQVLMFTGFDPVAVPVLKLLRGRIGTYNMHLRAIADARDCHLVDLWSMRFLRSPGAWSQDRLHLTAQSHQRVALRACEVLGIPVTEDWRAPLTTDDPQTPAQTPAPTSTATTSTVPALTGPVPAGPVSTGGVSTGGAATRAAWLTARREDARWAREYLAPWINRRLHGTSSGDGRSAKRPTLEAVAPPAVG